MVNKSLYHLTWCAFSVDRLLCLCYVRQAAVGETMINKLRALTTIMLRVFRFDPSFELAINPVNVMYIDVNSEEEIYHKYITEKELKFEFAVKKRDVALYVPNYLILRDQRDCAEPTISDIDIAKSIPGAHLPGTFTLSMQDIQRGNRSGHDITQSIKVSAAVPIKFVISIRSIFSDAEKLTTDQNEALMCSISYYYPRPWHYTMYVSQNVDFSRNEVPVRSAQFKENQLTNYKGVNFEILIRASYYMPAPRGSWPKVPGDQVCCIYFNDEYVELRSQKFETEVLALDLFSVPPPLHANLLIDHLTIDPNRKFLFCTYWLIDILYDFTELSCKLYKDATIPHFKELWEFSEQCSSSESEQCSSSESEMSTSSSS